MEFRTLYLELTNSTEMIQSLLAGISAKEAQMKPSKGTWSILEVICHLYDEEREDFREHLDFILYRQHEDWHPIAPQAWVKLRKYNEQDFGKMKAKFFRERAKSLVWLKSLKNTDWDITYKSKFGSMRAGDMFASWVAHDNLHIRQLVELRRWHIEQNTKPYKIRYAGEW
jgi:hypothetical protein